MSKIPDWAMADARKIAISLNGFSTPDDFQRIALALVEAERRGIEKAAAVAEAHANNYTDTRDMLVSIQQAAMDTHAECIAAAIRQLGDTP